MPGTFISWTRNVHSFQSIPISTQKFQSKIKNAQNFLKRTRNAQNSSKVPKMSVSKTSSVSVTTESDALNPNVSVKQNPKTFFASIYTDIVNWRPDWNKLFTYTADNGTRNAEQKLVCREDIPLVHISSSPFSHSLGSFTTTFSSSVHHLHNKPFPTVVCFH